MTKLTGTVTVHGDTPARTATVELHNASGDVVDQVMVDGDGRYAYHLAPGTWHLNVWDAHGHRGKAEVTLAEGENKELNIDLEEPEGGH
ncbi:MAG: carboxypeptidase-like regulatory domain-containing protein [Actinomycetota bacterium]